ncbi:transducin/WD40 repeat-like superfamily protein, partial [Tanacetum coccineum]
LESFERQDWISCVWGTSQDAMTSHVVVAAVLAVWYPNLVKPSLAMLCVHPLLKLVMAMNDKYSSTAAEILAEGIEHVNGASANQHMTTMVNCTNSPVHIVSLMTLIRVTRGSPRNLAPYLDKVVNFILQTMDPGNVAMREVAYKIQRQH